jgi:hypothetical protein
MERKRKDLAQITQISTLRRNTEKNIMMRTPVNSMKKKEKKTWMMNWVMSMLVMKTSTKRKLNQRKRKSKNTKLALLP